METNHTPSKWYQAHRENEEGMYSTEVFTKDGQVICTLHWYPKNEGNGVTSTYREANAKLISAAPDLLEACIWAKEQFKILADKGLYPEHLLTKNGGNGITTLVNAIEKAIHYKLVTE